MPDLEVGDILLWDTEQGEYWEVSEEHRNSAPLVFARPNGRQHCWCKRFNGEKFPCGNIELSWLRYRFKRDEFLTAAKKACAGE